MRELLLRALMRGEDLDPTAAGRVIRELVDERPLIESVAIAYEVAQAGIVGAADEPVGEPEGEEETPASPSPVARSASPDTTAPQL